MCTEIKNIKSKNGWNVFFHELAHHFPYGTLSVACALMLLSLIDVFFTTGIVECTVHSHSKVSSCGTGLDILFHSFHFIHILFSVSGTMTTFYRYSKNLMAGVVVGIFSSMIFCTLSDILFPYLAGIVLGIDMELHICFYSEIANILPFLIVGVMNGVVMSQVSEFRTEQNSLKLHFLHTFISAMASIFYAVGHGLSDFYACFGTFFLLMLGAVVLPCTLSDVVVPIMFAKLVSKK